MPPKILSGKEILKKVDLIPISWGKMKIKSLESNVNTNCWKKKSPYFLGWNIGNIFMFITTWMLCT